eukprot:TRINITY_DN3479_c0_g1_i1.p1 TRINITY_DN3479_c0_g1~~TRINITY_DN3479_c0_g1_i1.p1  ORF type:complete len:440 (-),score=101.09 TRINITY_DN3479_c0_g1_i1:412-1731(-)
MRSFFALLVALIFVTFAFCELEKVARLCMPQNDVPVGLVKGATLISVSTFTRHGDRTRSGGSSCWPHDHAVYSCPLKGLYATNNDTRPSDAVDRAYREEYMPGRNIMAGNCMAGQLTEIGYQQQQRNGQGMRRAFIGSHSLLPEDYTPSTARNFFLRSDDQKRTARSGQSLFSGMYPPTETAYMTSIVNWNTMDKPNENIYPNFGKVQHIQDCMTEATKDSYFRNYINKTTIPLATRIAKIFGYGSHNDVSLGFLMDCILSKRCHSMDVPLPDDVVNGIIDDNIWRYNFIQSYKKCSHYHGKSIAEMGMSSLMEEVAASIQKTIDAGDSKDAVRFSLYAGHDTGPIMPTFIALTQKWIDHWCPYAGTIHFQVYKFDSGEIKVLMTYNGKNYKPEKCSEMMCPWSEFKHALLSMKSSYDDEVEIRPTFDEMSWAGDMYNL